MLDNEDEETDGPWTLFVGLRGDEIEELFQAYSSMTQRGALRSILLIKYSGN